MERNKAGFIFSSNFQLERGEKVIGSAAGGRKRLPIPPPFFFRGRRRTVIRRCQKLREMRRTERGI